MMTGLGAPQDPNRDGRLGGDAVGARLPQGPAGPEGEAPAADARQGEPVGPAEAAGPGWWHVRPGPHAVTGSRVQGAGRQGRNPWRRLRPRARTLVVGVVGAALGAAAITLGLPAYHVAAQGYPKITTVPVTGAQESAGAPGVAVFRRLGPSIVLVTNQASVQSPFGAASQVDWGSGVVLTPTGYIVTNDHVVVGAQKVTVTLANGHSYPARLIGSDRSSDLAVIKINPQTPLRPATFANSNDVTPGELAVAIGNPLGPEFEQSVTEGIVSAIRPMLYGGISGTTPRVTEMIQTDAPINPGNSGGALANAQGEVIGITSMKVGQTGEPNLPAIGLGFAIPSNTVEKIVDQLIRLGHVPEPWIGVALNAQPADALPTQSQKLTVAQVVAGSPAAKADIHVGDVITRWQGKPVVNYWNLVGDINQASPGEPVTIGVNRNGQSVTIHLKLGTMPQNLAAQQASSSSAPAPSGSTPAPSGSAPSPYPFPFPFGGSQGG